MRFRCFPASVIAVLVGLLLPVPLGAQEHAARAPHAMTVATSDQLQWGPIEVPGFDSGLRIAVLAGDPASAGPYTLRLAFPDGYRFPAHWHPQVENMTVLMGTILLGEGTDENWESMTAYRPGDYLHIPARSAHYGGATGATVVQLHGTGPFEIQLAQ
jgi:quercetin dioxygenase-like cupin family protein